MADAGQTSTPAATPAPNTGRRDLLTNLVVMGCSGAGMASIVYALIGLVRDEPERGFRLLQVWGPWFFLAMFASWILYKLLEPLVSGAVASFGRISAAVEKQAESAGVLAAAVQGLAEKDDRQVQEMQTLTSLTAQRSERTYEMMREFHEDNQQLLKQQGEAQTTQGRALQDQAEMLRRIETKVDEQAKQAKEKS